MAVKLGMDRMDKDVIGCSIDNLDIDNLDTSVFFQGPVLKVLGKRVGATLWLCLKSTVVTP